MAGARRYSSVAGAVSLLAGSGGGATPRWICRRCRWRAGEVVRSDRRRCEAQPRPGEAAVEQAPARPPALRCSAKAPPAAVGADIALDDDFRRLALARIGDRLREREAAFGQQRRVVRIEKTT